MSRFLAFLAVILLFVLGGCDADQDAGPSGQITVYSTTDRAVFKPVIDDFLRLNPSLRVRYVDLDAGPLFDRFVAEQAAGRPRADLVLSSAIDLQFKLVNDGYAQRHASPAARGLPAEAKWRDEIFGLTFEPVVFVVNSDLLPESQVPRTRFALVRSLRDHPEFWRGRVGTYDIERSRVGYLLAAQDARQSSEFGALIGALGASEARTYANMSDLIADISAGRIALGYNVLSSYARISVAKGAHLQIVYPEDYTLAVVRAAFVARGAPNARGAHAFLEYLMSARGQQFLATRSELSAASISATGPSGRINVSKNAVGPLRPIPIGPGLLTYLDRMKRERFIENWRTALGTRAAAQTTPDSREP